MSIRHWRLWLKRALLLYLLFSSSNSCIFDWRGLIHKPICDLLCFLHVFLVILVLGDYTIVHDDDLVQCCCSCQYQLVLLLTKFTPNNDNNNGLIFISIAFDTVRFHLRSVTIRWCSSNPILLVMIIFTILLLSYSFETISRLFEIGSAIYTNDNDISFSFQWL